MKAAIYFDNKLNYKKIIIEPTQIINFVLSFNAFLQSIWDN